MHNFHYDNIRRLQSPIMTRPTTIGFNYFIPKHQGIKWNFIVYFYINVVPVRSMAWCLSSNCCQHENVATFRKNWQNNKMKILCTFRIELQAKRNIKKINLMFEGKTDFSPCCCVVYERTNERINDAWQTIFHFIQSIPKQFLYSFRYNVIDVTSKTSSSWHWTIIWYTSTIHLITANRLDRKHPEIMFEGWCYFGKFVWVIGGNGSVGFCSGNFILNWFE